MLVFYPLANSPINCQINYDSWELKVTFMLLSLLNETPLWCELGAVGGAV